MRNVLRLAASVSLVFLAGSASAFGQKAIQAQSENTIVTREADLRATPQRTAQACPVSLRAQHGVDGGIRNVDKSKPEGVAQLLHLILTSKNSREIVEARLRVRGVSPKGRVSNADTFTHGSADATRSVSVRFTPSGENEVSGKAWVSGLSAVLEVELNGVTYADGSIQRFNSADGCRFTPDHLMLIASDSR